MSPMIAVALHVARQVHVGELDALPAPHHPRVTALVVDQLERFIAVRGVDVVRPHAPRLVQVLIAVDDPSHGSQSPPVTG